jgi:tetratricopeptide (TPR) repeat protein
MLEQDQLTTEQRINTLLQRANASARLGHFAEAIHDCEAAIEMSRAASHQPCLIRALNARGWVARNQGQHDNALEDYLEAYQVSLQINDLQQTAWILNNIAFVNTLKGNRQAAFESSRAALDICQTQGFLRCMGAVYSNLGGIYVRFDQAPEALKHYTRALDIFSAEDDSDWMSLVHCGRSYAFLSRGELEKADDALTWAWDNGAVYLKPRILYARALTAWARNDLAGARQHLETCRVMSQQLGDRFHDYKSFADLTELAWEFHEYHRWQEFADQLNQLYTTQRASEDLLRLRGSCLRKIGDMAICAGSYADALDAYKEGLCLIAEHEVHEPYILRSQIRQTDRRIRERITGETMSQLGHDLMQFWRASKTLMEQYPDALLIFHRWERGETTI